MIADNIRSRLASYFVARDLKETDDRHQSRRRRPLHRQARSGASRSCWCTGPMPGWCASASMRWCAPRSTIPTIRSRFVRIEGEELVRQSGAAGRGSAYRAAVRRPPRRAGAGPARATSPPRSSRCSTRRRATAASSSRPAICAKPRRCARCARRRKPPRRCPAIADNDAAVARLIDEEMRAAKLTIAPDARAALIGAARRRPARLAQRDPQARALRAGPGARRARRRAWRWCRTPPSMALDGVLDAAFAGKTARDRNRIRQGARRRLLAGRDRLGGDPPCRQPAQDEARGRRRRQRSTSP